VRHAPGVQVGERQQEGLQHQLHRLPVAQPPALLVRKVEQVAARRPLLHQHHVLALLRRQGEGGEG
jgi:hypothetical protein